MKKPTWSRTVILGLAALALGGTPTRVGAELIGFYPFDNPNAPLEDRSGLANTLTSAGADPVYEPQGGVSGGAYRFDGSQRWVIPIDINPSALGHLTMGAWVRTTTLAPALRKVMGHDDGGWDRTIGLDTRAADGSAAGPFRYTSFTGSSPGPNELPGPVSTEHWTLLVAVYDDLTPALTIYVDVDANTVGDELASATVPDAFFGFGFPTASLGNLRPDNANEGWIGLIDNAFLFDRLLTPEEITAMRNKGSPDPAAQADPNFSAVSIPNLTGLSKSPSVHAISIPIRNDGASRPLNIASVTVSGTDASFYTVGNFPSQLAAGQQGTIEVTLDSRGQVGAFQGVLTVTSDDSVQPRATLDVSATVAADGSSDPSLSVVTAAPIFGEISSATATRTIQVRNAGAGQILNITSAAVVGADASHYQITGFSQNLPPGVEGPVTVTFNPQGIAKTFSAQLHLYSNDASNRLAVVDLWATVRSIDIRPSLIGFYPFDDASNPMKDESGLGRNLTEPADLALPTHEAQGGLEGGAYLFDGTTRLIAPININPTVIPELTLGAWVRADSIEPGLRKVAGHDNGAWDRVIGLDNRVPDGTFRYTAFTGSSPGPSNLPAPENTEDWTFLAATFNQTRRELVVYVDLDARTTSDALVSDTATANFGAGFNTFSIGSIRPDNASEGWVGSIDNVFLYNTVLTAAQLTQIRDGGKAFILSTPQVQAPTITSAAKGAGGFTLVWSSSAGASYQVQYQENLRTAWSTIATQASQGNSTSYQDTDAARLARPRGYYRVAVQP